MLLIITALCLLYVVYVFALYPALLWVLARGCKGKNTAPHLPEALPDIQIVVPAYNEAAVIDQKLVNHLALDYPRDKYTILVISDGSTDGTDQRVEAAMAEHPDRVQLFRALGRRGKTNAINEAAHLFKGEILVFSDANVLLDRDALKATARELHSPDRGGVCGTLKYVNEFDSLDGISESTSAYWKYEEKIKEFESLTGNVMGADGSIFAVKREYFAPLPDHVLDDFSTSMGVVFQGAALKFSREIIAYEKTAETESDEVGRKVRIANRSFNTYRHWRPQLRKMSCFDMWKFASHKLLRWFAFAPICLGGAAALAWIAPRINGPVGLVLGMGLVLLFSKALITRLKSVSAVLFKGLNFLRYFLLANLCTGAGVVASLRGEKIQTWKKADTAR